MAQLPPKIPNLPPNWPDFPSHQKIPSLASLSPNNVATNNNTHHHQNNPCWVDEFLDFSSARRGAHRRSMSDSIAFLEAPTPRSAGDNEFERFDDEQFMSMFTDDLSGNNPMPPTMSSSNPSSPSDHNSINDEKDTDQLLHQPKEKENNKEQQEQEKKQQLKQLKSETDEVESQCIQETQAPMNTNSTSSDKITDPKRVKR